MPGRPLDVQHFANQPRRGYTAARSDARHETLDVQLAHGTGDLVVQIPGDAAHGVDQRALEPTAFVLADLTEPSVLGNG